MTTNRSSRATTAPRSTTTSPRAAPTARRRGGGAPVRSGSNKIPKPIEQPAEVGPCEDAELVVVCHMPGCEITLNGQERHVTDGLGGFTFQVAANHRYQVRVAKAGYDTFEQRIDTRLECGDQREVNARLNAKPVALRIRTVPAECDIYLDRQKQSAGSGASGVFTFILSKPTLLVEAKKPGYLSATQTIVLAPEWANREVVLALEPISARLKLSVNVDDAQVTIDNEQSPRSPSDRLLLRPGPRSVTVEALGYSPVKFDLKVEPDESISKDVRLERLPVSALQEQAESLLTKRAHDDVLKLCRYIFEANKENGVAHRLEGSVHLARGDFNNAGAHFARALAAGEPVALRIRRHAAEKFELSKGHDACEGQLVLRKNELEFKGQRNPVDNFKVGFDQVQVGAIQLKNSVAVYLATKVIVNGKRRDFNFYSFDKELSQSGKPYLEVIQRLLRPH
ncbi:MAG TPA: carboxypeptidase regulatory-like domain-containing protein [Pyrinomonadaceae bacterium]